MLDKIDLSQRLSKTAYRQEYEAIEIEWGRLQRAMREADFPAIFVFEGWDAAGKGALINEFILPLDPRGFSIRNTQLPDDAEKWRPFLWRFWQHVPANGRMTLLDRSGYRRLLDDRVSRRIKKSVYRRLCEDQVASERALADDGAVVVKFWLHISRQEQARRLKRLQKDENTAWRVTRADWQRHRQYDRYLPAAQAMLTDTHSACAPWMVIEAENFPFAARKIIRAAMAAIAGRLARKDARAVPPPSVRLEAESPAAPDFPAANLDLPFQGKLDRQTYERRLKRNQKKLRDLHHQMYRRRQPALVLYEGWDAAGKGGNLKRLTRRLDPRGYEVFPVAAPNDVERAHHYLWRFWKAVPKAGHLSIMDRSWYGRVLVERVEGFCTESAWRRAYREINEMERHWARFGMVIVKFWLHIDADEQLRRFRKREKTDHKKWKITEEDWRNREKRAEYEAAVAEMLLRTHTPYAPWTVVATNCKHRARIEAQNTLIRALEKSLKEE